MPTRYAGIQSPHFNIAPYPENSSPEAVCFNQVGHAYRNITRISGGFTVLSDGRQDFILIQPVAKFWRRVEELSRHRGQRQKIFGNWNSRSGVPEVKLGSMVTGTSDRVMYLRNSLMHLQRATAEGIPVKGNFYWRAMDNLEWTDGFGTDRAASRAFARRPRDSHVEFCAKPPLTLDVLRQSATGFGTRDWSFRPVHIAIRIDRHTFTCDTLLTALRRMRWNESGDLVCVRVSDSDSGLPAGMVHRIGLRVDRIQHVVRCYEQPADAAELFI
jgi:hypothetical protein